MTYKVKYILLLICAITASVFLYGYINKPAVISNVQDFNIWLNDDEHCCTKTKKIAGVDLRVKYLPSAYLALRTVSTGERKGSLKFYDSLLKEQSNSLTFLLSIGPDKDDDRGRAVDVMKSDISDEAAFAERVATANFLMDGSVTLFIGNVEYKPVLHLVENAYELTGARNFMFVFAVDKSINIDSKEEYLLVYKDPFFNLGSVQFNFLGSFLKEASELKIVLK